MALAVITYVDRVCISQAAPQIQADLGLSASQMGVAFAAFSIAYAIFEVPTGWLGDRTGPGRVLLRIVVVWSMFTAATGYCWNLLSLVLTRFWFGAGEAGCFPNLTKAFGIWLRTEDRTRAQGIMWLSARWGGAFTPLLVIWVMSFVSWRNTFVLFGFVGVLWAVLFSRWLRTAPKPAVDRLDADHAQIPWRAILKSPSVWLLWLQYFCLTYGWFFYVTWMPTYLKETRGLMLNQNALMAWLETLLRQFISPEQTQKVLVAALTAIPLFLGGFGALLSGFALPRLGDILGGVARARRTLAIIGFGGASTLLVVSTFIRDPLIAMFAMGAASFSNDLTMPGTWSACMDIGGKFAGTLSGSMNMMGSIGAALAPLIIGWLLDHTGRNWELTFWISGIIYFCGGLCWLWLDPVTPLIKNAASLNRLHAV